MIKQLLEIDSEAWVYLILIFIISICGSIGIEKLTHNTSASICLGIVILGICYFLAAGAHSCRRLLAYISLKEKRQWIPFSWKLEEETNEYTIFSATQKREEKEIVARMKVKKEDYKKDKEGFQLRIGAKVDWIDKPPGL